MISTIPFPQLVSFSGFLNLPRNRKIKKGTEKNLHEVHWPWPLLCSSVSFMSSQAMDVFFDRFFLVRKGMVGCQMKIYIYICTYFCVSRCLQCRMKRRLILVCSLRWDVRYFKRTGAWRQWCVHADMCSFFSCSLALICFLLSLFLFAWLVCFCTHHYASHSWMYLLYYYTYIYI